MTNSTPTTEPKFAPLPTKEEAWYGLNLSYIDRNGLCVIVETGYLWGSPEDAKKYQDMLGERHNSEYNYPTLELVYEPETLAELESYGRVDRILIEDEIEGLQELIDDEANNPHN